MEKSKVKIESIEIFEIGVFKNKYKFITDGLNQIITGFNNSGKTTFMKCVDFFFNENNTSNPLSVDLISGDNPYIEIEFSYENKSVKIRKELKVLKTKIQTDKTIYSEKEFPVEISNHIENIFVYYLTSNKLLVEKDDEFTTFKKLITDTIVKETLLDVKSFDERIKSIIIDKFDDVILENKNLDSVSGNLSIKKGITINFKWIKKLFSKQGSGECRKTEINLIVSLMQKIPSIILIDKIETDLDYYSTKEIMTSVINCNKNLTFVTTLSWVPIKMMSNEFQLSIINSNQYTNKDYSSLQSDLERILGKN